MTFLALADEHGLVTHDGSMKKIDLPKSVMPK